MLKIYEQVTTQPVYDVTVQDNHNFYANGILVHNCTEITLPSRGSALKNERLYKEYEDLGEVVSKLEENIEPGLISLCNLSSINVVEWYQLDPVQKTETILNLLRASDNLIDYAYYPVAEGKLSNSRYRPIGIGLSNLAQLFAMQKIKYSDRTGANRFMFELMEDIAYHVYWGSAQLAKERGPFEAFYETKWAQGWLPIDPYLQTIGNDLQYDWNELRSMTRAGVRFACHLSIAPTACVTKETPIRTETGIKTLQQLMMENGIDYEYVEKVGIATWRMLKKPINVPSRYGYQQARRIWYNGKSKIVKVTFHTGESYKMTPNHKILIRREGKEEWVEAANLRAGDYAVMLSTVELKITEIQNGGFDHTYDLEVTPFHEFYFGNGVVTHNTSALIIGATESINPVKNLVSIKTGTYNCKQLVPNLNKLRQWYETAYDVPNRRLIELAAIRQIFMDQAQSIDLFYREADSAAEVIEDVLYADKLGVKTLYYANILKKEIDGDGDEKCESCSA